MYRSCVAGQYPPGITQAQCEAMNQIRKMYKYFMYQEMCCNQSVQAYNYSGITYNFQATSCICTSDNCNGAIPNYVTKKPSATPTQKDPVTPKTTKVVPTTRPTVKPPVKNVASKGVFQSSVALLCAVVFASAVGWKAMFAN